MGKKLPRRPRGRKPLPPPPKKGPKRPESARKTPPTRTKIARKKSAPRVRRASGLWRSLFKVFFVLVFLLSLVVATVGGYLFYRGVQSLPRTEGVTKLQGLTAPVEVVRDQLGVPHLSGSDVRDLARAMGYVHAQDRYFQMELGRRMGAGRLAEIFGPDALDQDRAARRIGLAQAAQRELDRMAPEAREVLEAYAAGVEAYRSLQLDKLPPEFQLLEHVPEPWRAVDSLTITKWFAYILSFNARAELLRARLVDVVGRRSAYLITGLSPPAEEDVARQEDNRGFHIARVAPKPHGTHPGASNAWVVGSERSASGRPLLAADPHLTLPIPSIFYEIRLSGGGIQVAGASVPGVPLVLFGQNQRIAWGMTALFADVQDVYIETVHPENPRQYAFGDQWMDVDIVPESIDVKDGPAVTEDVRFTRHGVVVGETSGGHLLAERWDALWNGDHVAAVLQLNRAGSWEEFVEALRGWASPALSFIYADVEGNIGFFPAGDIPVRVGFDGNIPINGSSGEFEWSGIIPHELKPMLFNPEDGVIVSANQQMLPADTPYPFGLDTLAAFRADRITDLLLASRSHGLEDFARIQGDRYDASSEPVLRFAVALAPSDPLAKAAVELLRNWNGQMDGGAAPAIYHALYRELLVNTFIDELGADLFDAYLEFLELGHAGGLHAILDDPSSAFWDDQRTTEIEDRSLIFQRSLDGAVSSLSARLGEDVDSWDWRLLHGVRFDHPMGREQPWSWLFSRGPILFGGSTFTIANAVVSLREPFDTTVGTSFRFLADLSDLSQSRSSVPTGASGHPLSPHYFDQNEGWLAGRSHALLGGAPESKLVLQP